MDSEHIMFWKFSYIIHLENYLCRKLPTNSVEECYKWRNTHFIFAMISWKIKMQINELVALVKILIAGY